MDGLDGANIRPGAIFENGQWYPLIALELPADGFGNEVLQINRPFKTKKKAIAYAARKLKHWLPNMQKGILRGYKVESTIPDDM